MTGSTIMGPLFTFLAGNGPFAGVFFREIRTRYPGDGATGTSCDVVCRYLRRPLFRPIRRFKWAFTEGSVSPPLLPNEGTGMRRSGSLPLICRPSSPPALPLLFPSTGPPGNERRRSPPMPLRLMKCQMCVRHLRRVDLRARFFSPSSRVRRQFFLANDPLRTPLNTRTHFCFSFFLLLSAL